MTKIEWAEDVWNPTLGCSRVSPGCDRCYAMHFAHRGLDRSHRGLTVNTDAGVDWTGEVRTLPERLDIPLKVRKPTRWFVDSMSDLFHPTVPDDFIADVFAVMAQADHHTFQVLTKRPQVAARWFDWEDDEQGINRRGTVQHRLDVRWARGQTPLRAMDWPLPNVWLGTSIESDRYTFRADHLRATPAAVRWLSFEPLLGPLPSLDLTGIDWVVAGGESGPGARPMHPAWVRDIRDRCQVAGVPFFLKQWGEWLPVDLLRDDDGSVDAERDNAHLRAIVERGGVHQRVCWLDEDGTRTPRDPGNGASPMARIGKRWAGRTLDRQVWHQFPEGAR